MTPVERGSDTHPRNDSRSARRRPAVAAVGLLAFASIMVALHLIGAHPWRNALWGAHFLGFLPAWALAAALSLVVLSAAPLTTWILATVRTGGAVGGSATEQDAALGAGTPSRRKAIALTILASLAAAVVLWTLRARHTLLGDGLAILSGGVADGGVHELEPLTMIIQSKVFELMSVLSGPASSVRQLTWNSVALVSVASGALFVPVTWALAGEILSGAEPEGARSPAGARDPKHRANPAGLARALVFAVLLSQGYLQLFCGYVENYAPVALANALVLLTGLRFLRGRGSLLAAGVAMLLAVGLHLSAFAMFPAWCVLALWGLSRGPNRRRARIDLAVTILLAGALTLVLAWRQSGYLLPRTLLDVTLRALGQRQEDPTYLLSLRHLGDFLNEQLLIGPLGIFAFAVGLGVTLASGAWRRIQMAFAIAAGLGYAVACGVAGDSNLGYARNWDLLAPASVVFTAAGLMMIRPAFGPAGTWRRSLTLAAGLSLFHTLPWIALNASEAASLERFKALPLGHGRTENTVAFWYAERGDLAEAKRWLVKSLKVDPYNNRAVDLLGRIAFEERRPRDALRSYLIAVTLRPDKNEYRRQLAIALAMAGGPEVGLRELSLLMEGHEDNGALWLERSMLMHALGREREAAEAKARALRLTPGLAPFPDTLPQAVTAPARPG